MKSVCIRSFSGLYFPTFVQNTENYSVNLHIQFECREIQSIKTPNTDTFYVVTVDDINMIKVKIHYENPVIKGSFINGKGYFNLW